LTDAELNSALGLIIGDHAGAVSGVVNAQTMGVVADGAADCTATLQSAVRSAHAARRRLYLPAGKYRVLGTVVVPGDLDVYGDGATSTVVVGTSTNQEQTVFYVPTGTGQIRFTMSALKIQGGGKQIHVHGPGLWLRESFIRDVEFKSFLDCGLEIGAVAIGTSHHNLNFQGGTGGSKKTCGIRAVGESFLNAATFANIRAVSCSGAGLWIEDTAPAGSATGQLGVELVQPTMEGNSGAGIYLKGGGINAHGMYVEQNRGGDVVLDSNFAGGAVSKTLCHLYSPNFNIPHADQYGEDGAVTRVVVRNHFTEIRVHNALLYSGVVNQIDAGGYYSTNVTLHDSPMRVKSSIGATAAQRSQPGLHGFGSRAAAGVAWSDTGVNVNARYYGGAALIMASRHVQGSPVTAQSALYMLTYGYGNDAYAVALMSGTDIAEFSAASGGALKFRPIDGTNVAVTVLSTRGD
jgi:hypothetical protein